MSAKPRPTFRPPEDGSGLPQKPRDPGIELERYELDAPLPYHFHLDRRDFHRTLGCGLAVLLVSRGASAQESGRRGRGRDEDATQEVGAWLHVGEDDRVTVFTGKTEVGQNIRTSLSQAVAEELAVPIATIEMVMADTDRVPYDRGTFGSLSTPQMNRQLRQAAAAAREALVDLAAERFQCERATLEAADGKIRRKGTDQAAAYGQLTKGQRLIATITGDAATVTPGEWQVLGREVRKVNGRAFVTGEHRYASDIRRPEMLYGKILRPPSFGAQLSSVDSTSAENLPGVSVVRDGEFLGVTAGDVQTAAEALASIRAEWSTAEGHVSHRDVFRHLKESSSEGGGGRSRRSGGNSGSVEDGLQEADHTREATYTIAYIAHAPLEPRAAVAEWQDGKLTVWTGTQRPFGVRGELAEAFRIDEDRIRVIVPDTGSGYGGKHTGEAAIEAARLAKSVGRPVKVVWTRKEEFTWAYQRPAGVIDITAGVRNDGTLTAWEFHNYNSGGSALETQYEVANRRTQFHGADSPLRQGSYRALAATANTFARECHMDELAEAVDMDPVAFRLKNLTNKRLRAVLQAAADSFGWDEQSTTSAAGHGVGIACGTEKGSYIATCAEVRVSDSGEVTVVRATSAFECGPVCNPDQLKNQVEGSMVMGIGGALFEAVEFEDGKITNPYFSSYRVPRFSDMPEIEVVLVDRTDLPPVGAGETPIIGIAPAIGNALFAATGKRVRSLPLAPRGLVDA